MDGGEPRGHGDRVAPRINTLLAGRWEGRRCRYRSRDSAALTVACVGHVPHSLCPRLEQKTCPAQPDSRVADEPVACVGSETDPAAERRRVPLPHVLLPRGVGVTACVKASQALRPAVLEEIRRAAGAVWASWFGSGCGQQQQQQRFSRCSGAAAAPSASGPDTEVTPLIFSRDVIPGEDRADRGDRMTITAPDFTIKGYFLRIKVTQKCLLIVWSSLVRLKFQHRAGADSSSGAAGYGSPEVSPITGKCI